MKQGTKSVLFGVHQFLWHPITVARAWHQLYKRWPVWWEWVVIFFHDLGYIGCPDMDGDVGQMHPKRGADWAAKIVWRLQAWGNTLRHPILATFDENFRFNKWGEGFTLSNRARRLGLGHSRYYCEKVGCRLSPLFRADKLCTRFDPIGFYLLRARLSGEIKEYLKRSPLAEGTTSKQWAAWYYLKVEQKFA